MLWKQLIRQIHMNFSFSVKLKQWLGGRGQTFFDYQSSGQGEVINGNGEDRSVHQTAPEISSLSLEHVSVLLLTDAMKTKCLRKRKKLLKN